MVAGLWSAAYSLGEVIGPSVGGVLLQYHGFPIAATTMAVMNLVLVIVCIFYFPSKKRKSEEEIKAGRICKDNEQKNIENIRYGEMSLENTTLTIENSNSDDIIRENNKVAVKSNGIKIEQIENGGRFKQLSNESINIMHNDNYVRNGVTSDINMATSLPETNSAVISITEQNDECKRTKL